MFQRIVMPSALFQAVLSSGLLHPANRCYYPSKHQELLSLDTTQYHKGLESTGVCQGSENSYILFLNYDAV
jgi:hypothetical protein